MSCIKLSTSAIISPATFDTRLRRLGERDDVISQIGSDAYKFSCNTKILKIQNEIEAEKNSTNDLDKLESLYEKLQKKPEVYIYSIWNPVSFKTQFPSLYVNISKTFSAKLKSLHKFKSQKFQAIYPLMTIIFFRAFRDGIKMRKKFGEHFFRVK